MCIGSAVSSRFLSLHSRKPGLVAPWRLSVFWFWRTWRAHVMFGLTVFLALLAVGACQRPRLPKSWISRTHDTATLDFQAAKAAAQHASQHKLHLTRISKVGQARRAAAPFINRCGAIINHPS